MRSISAVATAALVIGFATGPAFADASSREVKTVQDPDRMVCKTKPKTGSRIGTRTCHTAREWDIIAEENRRIFNEANGPTVNTARGN